MRFFTSGNDLQGALSPLDLKHIKYLRYGLLCFGAWPGHLDDVPVRFQSAIKLLHIILFFIGVSRQMVYLKNIIGIETNIQVYHACITFLMGFVALLRFISMFTKSYEMLLTDFITDLHLLNNKIKSDYSKKMNQFIHKLSHFFTIYTLILFVIAGITFNLGPLLLNIFNLNKKHKDPLSTNITYKHAIYFALPFDYEHNLTGCVVVYIINIYYSVTCAMVFTIYDLLIALVVFHLWGHIKILIDNLENFPRPGFTGQGSNDTASINRYTKEDMPEVTKILRTLIKCHKFTIKYNNKISDSVGVNVAIYFTFHQISGCLLLLQCSQLNIQNLISFIPLTIGLSELLVRMSVVFEVIKSMSDPLMRAAYNVPWECMDVKNRKLVLMMLRMTQTPMGLKAMGMVDVGVQTMATILKTTFSYYMMLRALEKN